MKETVLAKKIVTYFENKNLTCYKEVSKSGTGGAIRCDCYFVKKEKDVIVDAFVIEVKTTLSLKVIEQAFRWKAFAKKVYIGVPKPKRRPVKSRRFAVYVCQKLGVGIFEVSENGNVEMLTESEINPKFKLPPLFEEQKKSKAGNAKSEYFTVYKKTIANINDFMKDKTEYKLSDLFKEIDHHYSNISSAQGCIKKYIKKGVITNYKIKQKGKQLYIEKI